MQFLLKKDVKTDHQSIELGGTSLAPLLKRLEFDPLQTRSAKHMSSAASIYTMDRLKAGLGPFMQAVMPWMMKLA
jgi:hypothetical protein